MARITKKQQALNRAKWCDALESGKYKQGRGVLHYRKKKTDYFCCLGVACLLAKEDGLKLRTQEVINDEKSTSVWYDECDGLLPDKVMNWLGISTNSGEFKYTTPGGAGASLIALNDDAHLSFKKIAKIIRENESGLR